MCGHAVYKDAVIENERLQYEHIWPSGYGGDSIEENILPACSICNNAKEDMILWHTAHIAGFCLKPQPSADELTRVGRKQKIAWFMRRTYENAVRRRITLKESALSLGPIEMSKQDSVDPDDARDFFNLTL